MKKRLIFAAFAALAMLCAHSQAQVVAPGHVIGNGTSANHTATDAAISAVIDQGICQTNGSVILRGSLLWACGTPPAGFYGTVAANKVLAGPTTGSAAASTFRSLVGADLPNPGASSLGGIESYAVVSHQWINSISTLGVVASSQPAIGDISGWGTGVASALANPLPWPTSVGGTGQTSASAAFGALAPTPTRAGDILYWNGTVWVTLAGNNSGTQVLQETSSGVPSWGPVAGTGTVIAGGGGIVPISGSPSTLFSEQMPLGGRVTPSSGNCIPTTDQAAQTTIYYAPCGSGKYLPIYDGTNMELHQFTSSDTDTVGLSLALGSNWAANTIFDLFVTLNGGVVTPCTVAWSNSGAGTSTRATAVAQFKGVWTNSASMTCRTSNTTTITVAANQGTLVGGFRTNGSTGTVDLKFGTAASGGGTACICVWNVYNTVQAKSFVSDTTVNWTYTTATFRQADGSAGNQINVLQGLAGSNDSFQVMTYMKNSAGSANCIPGIGIDSTTADSSLQNVECNSGANIFSSPMAFYEGALAVGFHNINWLEYSSATGTSTWEGYLAPTQLVGIMGKVWY